MIIEDEEATSTRKRLVRSTIRENEGAMSIEKRFVSGRYETRSTITYDEGAMSIGKRLRRNSRLETIH